MNNILLHLWNQYKIYVFTALSLTMLASVSLSTGLMPLEQARSANDFVDSIGVAVHISYRDTGYDKYNEIIKPRLQELGVSHIRDGVRLEDVDTQQKFLDLAKIGIKSTLVMDPRDENTSSRAVTVVKSILESVEAVEGPNEWEMHPELQYAGQSFPEGVRQFQAELYKAMKADPSTAYIPVLSPSILADHKAPELGKVACDIGNIHHYPRGKWGIPIDGIEGKLTVGRILCGNQSIIMTESGYNTSVYDRSQYGVSEKVAAKYLLRLFLEYFNLGIKRFYTYELIDFKPNSQGSQSGWHYGLLRYDGSPKPDFIALKNLISLLKDANKTKTSNLTSNLLNLKPLEATLQGNTTNIHQTLLQKSNGNFYLILWQEVPSFEHQTKTELVVPKRLLTLTLNTPISKAAIYQPVNSITPLKKYKNVKRLKLQVPDHPLVIELTPT
ncbi:MAG: hypothetical protein RLZZ499_1354 [Cyanobacteriota bacterium]